MYSVESIQSITFHEILVGLFGILRMAYSNPKIGGGSIIFIPPNQIKQRVVVFHAEFI